MPKLYLHSGKLLDPWKTDPKCVCIEDIAHALSYKCRFTGHTSRFYSVAQHSLMVSAHVPEQFALAGLLHDAAEAYLPDIATPIKHEFFINTDSEFIPFSRAENELLAVITLALGLEHLDFLVPEIKSADRRAAATEMKFLMPVVAPSLIAAGHPPFPDVTAIYPHRPAHVELVFLKRYQELKSAQAARRAEKEKE